MWIGLQYPLTFNKSMLLFSCRDYRTAAWVHSGMEFILRWRGITTTHYNRHRWLPQPAQPSEPARISPSVVIGMDSAHDSFAMQDDVVVGIDHSVLRPMTGAFHAWQWAVELTDLTRLRGVGAVCPAVLILPRPGPLMQKTLCNSLISHAGIESVCAWCFHQSCRAGRIVR